MDKNKNLNNKKGSKDIKETDKIKNGAKETNSLLSALIEILSFFWDIGKTLIIVIAVAFVIRFYLVQPFYVEGQSMEPNFTDGEYLLIDEISYHFRPPARGDVVVFKPPTYTYQNYIKRIIALPLEKIEFKDNKVLIINEDYPEGKKLQEDYLPGDIINTGEEGPKLNDREFFVLGDNRSQSSDSRAFGPLSQKNIIGRVWFYIKTEKWKELELFGIKIKVPKISKIGMIKRPEYNM